MNESKMSDFEERQLKIQYAQLELENKKLQIEARKTKLDFVRTWITPISIAVPILAVVISVVWSDKQLEKRTKVQEELKVAEIVMGADGVYDARNRLAIIEALLGRKLAPSDIDSDQFYFVLGDQWEYLTLVAKHPNEENRIIELWKTFWPEDYEAWLHKVDPHNTAPIKKGEANKEN
jgi:hypothetical protein